MIEIKKLYQLKAGDVIAIDGPITGDVLITPVKQIINETIITGEGHEYSPDDPDHIIVLGKRDVRVMVFSIPRGQGKTPVPLSQKPLCDACKGPIVGKEYPMYDEQNRKKPGFNQCGKCFAKTL